MEKRSPLQSHLREMIKTKDDRPYDVRRDVVLVTPDWNEDKTRRSLRILVKRRKTNFSRASGIEYECAQHDKIQR